MFGFRPNPSDEQSLEEFENQATNAAEIQTQVLQKIISHNARTEYLQSHGCVDIQSFKSKVPVVSHADIASYVERIADGDKSPILCADPVEKLFLSSGTSAGKSKMIPVTSATRLVSANNGRISPALRNKKYELPENSAVLAFVFAAKRFKTKSGLMAGTATSSHFHSKEFVERDHAAEKLTTPDEIILQGANFKQVMYCHLLCGLLRREEVGVVMSFFAYMLVEALRMLESSWEEICKDLRAGSLRSERVTDPVLRKSMSAILKEANEELAHLVEAECERSFEGIISRLWPNAKFVMCVMTGGMAPYAASLRQYAGNVPLVNSDYGASECFPIGINMNPLDPPEKVAFTLVPSSCYYEFCPVVEAENHEEKTRVLVDLSNVKAGETYEVVLTTFSGLYRYRLGDVIKIRGFYKSLPRFSFVRRMNVVLSINTDKTDEKELQLVLQKAGELLKERNQEISDYTSYADVNSKPGHYVIFIQLRPGSASIDEKSLQACSDMMDSSFNNPYLRGRSAQTIGPLELCVVGNGTFSRLLECAISQGTSASQFKTPRCITNPKMLSILRENTAASFFSASLFS